MPSFLTLSRWTSEICFRPTASPATIFLLSAAPRSKPSKKMCIRDSDYAFLGFDIGSVTLGDGVKKIGKSAFCYCKSLASLSLGDSVEEIGERAFNMCTSLAELSLGTGLGNIGKYAFAYCENLSCTVRLPASLTEIGYAPFTDTPITAFEVAEGNPAY